jgi:hypothetical protein
LFSLGGAPELYDQPVKRCKQCGEAKPLDEFYVNATCNDGRRPECKVCNLAGRARKYAANPQPYIDRVKRWQQENSERLNAYRREYRRRPERKTADREGYLMRKYRMTLADYERMFEAQLGDFREEYELFRKAADYLDRDDELAGLVRARVGALGS